MKKIKVEWLMDKGDIFGLVTGYDISMHFSVIHAGCPEQEILLSPIIPIVPLFNVKTLGAIRKRVIKEFKKEIAVTVDDIYRSIAEIEEQDRKEWEAANAAHKKWLAHQLDLPTITTEMKQYVINKCRENGYDVTLEDFEEAIVSNSPRGAFARSFLVEIDDRPGIYSYSRGCVDTDTVSLVGSLINEPETIIS